MAALMRVTCHKRTIATAFDRCLQIIKMCNFLQFFAVFNSNIIPNLKPADPNPVPNPNRECTKT